MPQKLPDTNSSKTALERRRDKALERSRRWRANNPDKARESSRAGFVRHKYGLTLVDIDAMNRNQNGLCSICQKNKPLCVDHNHNTGVVRGLLCRNCNQGLGHFKDDFSILIRAANYVGWRSN